MKVWPCCFLQALCTLNKLGVGGIFLCEQNDLWRRSTDHPAADLLGLNSEDWWHNIKEKLSNIQRKQMGTNSTVQCLNTLQLLIYNGGLCGRRFHGSCGGEKHCSSWTLYFCFTKHHVLLRHVKRALPYFAWLNITHITGVSLRYVGLIVIEPVETKSMIYFDFKIHNLILYHTLVSIMSGPVKRAILWLVQHSCNTWSKSSEWLKTRILHSHWSVVLYLLCWASRYIYL